MKLYVLKNWLKRLTKHCNNVYRPVVVFRPSGGVFTLFYPSRIPTAKIYHFVTMYYFHPCLLAKSPIAKQNCSHRANVINNGSPSRIRMVRRISLGMTTRPKSSMRRTIPVAFIISNPSCPSQGRSLFLSGTPGHRSHRRLASVHSVIIRNPWWVIPFQGQVKFDRTSSAPEQLRSISIQIRPFRRLSSVLPPSDKIHCKLLFCPFTASDINSARRHL